MFELYKLYAVLIIFAIIAVLIAVGVAVWYFRFRCKNNVSAAEVCTKNCDCVSPQLCALESADPSAQNVCCSVATFTLGSKTYCSNLANGKSCVSNNMCASGLCSGTNGAAGVCIPAATPNPGPNPGPGPSGPSGSGSQFTGGLSNCSTTETCPSGQTCGVVLGAGLLSGQVFQRCCTQFIATGPATNDRVCINLANGSFCSADFFCASQHCLSGVCTSSGGNPAGVSCIDSTSCAPGLTCLSNLTCG